MQPIDLKLLRESLLGALREDVGSGDITARATLRPDMRAVGKYASKQELVVAGLPVLQELVSLADPEIRFEAQTHDGASVSPRAVLAEVNGPACSIVSVERTSLNLLQRMCGIATLTRKFVSRIEGTRARIVDTRKTAPGLRLLDKYAVTCGGGMNHRTGLFDGVLIKNNHLVFHKSVASAIEEARQHLGYLVKIEVEVSNLDELRGAIEADANVIMLDNFDADRTRQAVEIAGGRVRLESSGGITLENVRSFAETGVDYISVGTITHSAPASDIHLRVTPR